jgi:hypothetical protein
MEEDEINRHRVLFSNTEEIIVSIHTWNVNGSKYIKENLDLTNWLKPYKDLPTADIFIVGLAEMVELNANNILFNDNSKNVDLWKNLLITNLAKIDV